MALAGPAVHQARVDALRAAARPGESSSPASGAASSLASLAVPVLLPAGLAGDLAGARPARCCCSGPSRIRAGRTRRRCRGGQAPARRRRRRARRLLVWPTGCTGRAWCRRWSTWPTSRRAGAASAWSSGRLAWLLLRPRARPAGGVTQRARRGPDRRAAGAAGCGSLVQVAALGAGPAALRLATGAARPSLAGGFAGDRRDHCDAGRDARPGGGRRPAPRRRALGALHGGLRRGAGGGWASPWPALFAATGESHAAVFGVGLGFSLASLAAAVVLALAMRP